ncbi:conserved hypothetical protein [Candidatus Zixiibacteriota bacterium]|nr:conserved hypothetical protein [candidate division Zixibacteria bacterium]
MIKTVEINFSTAGNGHIINLTDRIEEAINSTKISQGIAVVFVPGSTAGLTTIEFEPGLMKDLPEFFEKIIPSNTPYHHDLTWHDGNGFSHLRAALIGPDLTIPFSNRKMHLGTWQQIVFLEFDNRSRRRSAVIQIIGD